MAFNIGPGVKQKMAELKDEPRSDEIYYGGTNTPGDRISITYGRDRVYYYMERDNATKTIPFE